MLFAKVLGESKGFSDCNFLVGHHRRSIDIDKLPEADKADMVIEPGEVVFVLTEETLELTEKIMATSCLSGN